MKRPELGLVVRTIAQSARVSACQWQDFVATYRTHMDDVPQHMYAVLHGHGTPQLHVPVFVHRPGQAVANSHTVHSSPFVFALLCFFDGRASRWLGRHFVCKELLSSLFGASAPPVSRPQRTYVQSIHQEQRELEWERWTRPTLRTTQHPLI